MKACRERAGLVALSALLTGCHWHWLSPPAPGQDDCNPADAGPTGTLLVQMDVHGEGFYASPYPSLARALSLDPRGSCPASSPLISRVESLLPNDGYATTAGVFFGLSSPPDPAKLPPSYGTDSPVQVDAGDLDGGSALPSVFLARVDLPVPLLHPVVVERARVNPQNPCAAGQNLLSVLPVQGRPLAPDALYAAVVTTKLGAQASSVVQALCSGPPFPSGWEDAGTPYQQALSALHGSYGLSCAEVAGMTVFKTGDPTAEFRRFVDEARREGIQAAPSGALKAEPGRCASSSYCVLVGQVQVPVYQQGTPPYAPYLEWGGGWVSDGGVPQLQGWVFARAVVTLPKSRMSDAGFPVVVLVRAGAGGSGDPLVDRGPAQAPSCVASACHGPAEVFAAAGFAGITVDGPLVGISRASPLLLNEDFAIFDFLNPLAMRDSVRQSALELAILPDALASLQVDPSEVARCPGVDTGGAPARFDLSHLALFSHSMGSSISPLALAVEPRYRAAILSGSGGSFIENAIYKTEPVPLTPAASLYGYAGTCQPHARDPEVSLLQWALEPADSQVYGRWMISDADAGIARDVLMVQGIIDHYILPPIADAMILSEGLDLGTTPQACSGRPDCDTSPEPNGCAPGIASPGYPSISTLLALAGAQVLSLPIRGNRRGPSGEPLTALVVQHWAPQPQGCPCIDGHEVAYEVDLARHQEECFLRGFLQDGDAGPTVVGSGSLFEACP